MSGSSSLNRIIEDLRRQTHDYRPSLEVFPDLDVEKIAFDLDLEQIGKDRGSRGDPPTNSSALDDVEMRIVERVDVAKRIAHGNFEDQLQTYGERLRTLNIDGIFGEIQQAGPSCISDIKAEVAKGRNELHGLRRDLKAHESEYDAFRAEHRLTRVAQIKSGPVYVLKRKFLLRIGLTC